MKYSSKFKTPRKHLTSQTDELQARAPPPQPQPEDLQPNPSIGQNAKKQKKQVSYFKHEQQSITAYKELERSNEGEGSKRLDRMGALLGNIMSKHLQMKRKLERLKREKENKQTASLMELTFEPQIRLNPRYPVNAPMPERNKSWDEARAQHFTSIRQEAIENEVRECTFSPKFVSKHKSQLYLKEREFKTQAVRSERDSEEINKLEGKFLKMQNVRANFQKPKERKKSGIDLVSIKSMIKTEISRISFNF